MDFADLVSACRTRGIPEIVRPGAEKMRAILLAILSTAGLWQSAAAADYPWRPYTVSEERAPCSHYEPLRQVFFGDTHVHTAYSLDAGTLGTRNRPDDAYRFARGERLGIQPYTKEGRALRSMQLERPLDFAVVTDHAEFLGETAICLTKDAKGYYSPSCLLFRWLPRVAFVLTVRRMMNPEESGHHGFCGEDGAHCQAMADSRWRDIQAAAERAYDRSANCTFSSFAGYEWTGAFSGGNLHRNVIFRNRTVPQRPLSFLDTQQPRVLWEWLENSCNAAGSGCDALAIPHNSNISGGYMFPPPEAMPLSVGEAKLRAEIEPLMEITQHKGSSECWLKGGGPRPEEEDALCGYEKLPYVDFASVFKPKEPPMYPWAGFARGALANGLHYMANMGANPYRLGFIGSTDTHLGTPGAVAEQGYPGHGGGGKSARKKVPPGLPDNPLFGPGGLAAVWAEENTRDALFAAMKRRETYGTSGPRIQVRLFAGWEYPQALCQDANFAAQGYRGGVAMGGTLPPPPPGAAAPRFAVRALRDPGTTARLGMPLQRIQVIKGWIDNEGIARDRVYEVAGDPNNGARVDTATCQVSGTGFDQLCAVWQDPNFVFGQQAYYYARVVENPSCRWSQYLCNARGVDCAKPETIGKGLEGCCAEEHRPAIQERAWTSPVWYQPVSGAARPNAAN